VPSPRNVTISLLFACAAALAWGGQGYLGERNTRQGVLAWEKPLDFPIAHQGHEQRIDLEYRSPLRPGSDAHSLPHGERRIALDRPARRHAWGADFFGVYGAPRPLLDDFPHAIGDTTGLHRAHLASPLPLSFGTAGIRSMSVDEGGGGSTSRQLPEVTTGRDPTPSD
jgi:hypothetical protein